MAKHVESQTTTEKEVTENVDMALSKTGAFIIENKKALLIALGVLLLVVAGVLVYNSVMESKESEASAQLALGQNYFAIQNYEVSLEGDSLDFPGFPAIADEFGWTKSGKLAKVYAGLSYYKLGRYDEAIESLKNVSLKDDVLKYNVLATVGDCYAQQGDLDNAIKYFEKAAKADLELVKANALFKLAKAYESAGKKDKALKAYQRIKEECGGKVRLPDVMEVDKYIEMVSE